MFERFSSDLCRAMDIARETAQTKRATLIGVDHLLLGLLGRSCGAVRVLRRLHVDVDGLCAAVAGLDDQVDGSPPPERIPPFTDSAAHILELAVEDAGDGFEHFVATEHVLTGIVRDSESSLARLLLRYGVTLSKVREVSHELPGLEGRLPSRHHPDST